MSPITSSYSNGGNTFVLTVFGQPNDTYTGIIVHIDLSADMRGSHFASSRFKSHTQKVVCFKVIGDTSARIQVSTATGYLCDLLQHESNNKAGAGDT